jgi:hypothetical protein
MKYYCLGPQAAGDLGDRSVTGDLRERPPKVYKFHLQLERWPKDDLIDGFATYACTKRLAEALTVNKLSGFELDTVEITHDDQFHIWASLHENETLPEFLWLKITGKPGIDDFGMIQGPCPMPLVVSDRALRLLNSFKLTVCEIEEYSPKLSAAG